MPADYTAVELAVLPKLVLKSKGKKNQTLKWSDAQEANVLNIDDTNTFFCELLYPNITKSDAQIIMDMWLLSGQLNLKKELFWSRRIG